MERKRKPVELLRVPFNCNIAPATKEIITGIQNRTRESQGAIIDRVFAALANSEDAGNRHKRQSRKGRAMEERAAGDVVAQAVEREDIDYSDVDSAPTVNVANLRGTTGAASLATSKAVEKWRRARKPLLKPKDR